MPFEKGKSGNPKGKPPGTKSEKTEFWNQVKDWFMEEGAAKYMEEMGKLKGASYINAYNNGLEFFKPKLARTELSGEVKNKLEIIITHVRDKGK
mgnify:CR=1 FL=1